MRRAVAVLGRAREAAHLAAGCGTEAAHKVAEAADAALAAVAALALAGAAAGLAVLMVRVRHAFP